MARAHTLCASVLLVQNRHQCANEVCGCVDVCVCVCVVVKNLTFFLRAAFSRAIISSFAAFVGAPMAVRWGQYAALVLQAR
jgi:hypothetical protein